ncbi:hypothetical protein [Rheinheimera sp. 4Y26]|uniref:hypothetical protein n=2 Tax=unclassified Rheinheimera TaxID=115860 RepID=UPI0021B12944|nr:hypothetical protein [Rheinheimera sp. 4Y26]MCT6700887.1 hypothetical protein [Rheinheimera sp. 4Y26]
MNKKMNTPSTSFTVNEVVLLLNLTVIKQDRGDKFLPENLGIICGVLTLNEEVEMVVKFIDRVCQFTKSEFNRHYRIINE